MRPLPLLLAGALALGACSGAATSADGAPSSPTTTGSGPTAAGPATGSVDPQLLAPLAGLPACDDRAPEATAAAPDGMPLPDGAAVTSVTTTGSLTNVQGWLPSTPVQTRVFYEGLAAWTPIQTEDEIREAEVLVSDGARRMFLKAQAVCATGSIFVAVIAPDDLADQVPAPAGAGS